MKNLDELKAEVEGLEQSLNDNPAYTFSWTDPYTRKDKPSELYLRTCRLIDFVPRNGASKGEIQHLTVNQYKAMHRGVKSPRPEIMTPDGRVRWEYALDELAQELGYQNKAEGSKHHADELLRLDIERGYRERSRMIELKRELAQSQVKSVKENKPMSKKVWTEQDSAAMDEAGQAFKKELDAILQDGNRATDLCTLVTRFYLLAGHRRIGRALVAAGKSA